MFDLTDVGYVKRIVVGAINPEMMVQATGQPGLEPVATDAGSRLRRVLDAVAADSQDARSDGPERVGPSWS